MACTVLMVLPPVTDTSTVTSGDTVNVFLTTSADYQTTTTATLTVGTLAVDFNATTRKKDTKPSYIVPTSVTGAAVNSYVLANDITFTEFDGDDMTIMGAEYKINEGDWTAPGTATINENDVMSLRVLSSSSYSTQVTSSVNGNGWAFEFNVTTLEGIAPTVIFNKAFEEDGSTPLNGSEELVLTFSQSMQIDTLNLIGDMVPDCNDLADETSCLNLVWSENDTVLTMSPKEDFYWYADVRSLQVAIIGDGILGLDETVSATVLPVFETFQAADVVIGQNDFHSSVRHAVGTNKLNFPNGVTAYKKGDKIALLITDSDNNRIVEYFPVPSVNSADHGRLFGQINSDSRGNGSNSNELDAPLAAVILKERIYITDQNNDRVIGVSDDNFDVTEGLVESGVATSLFGQSDFASVEQNQCGQNRLSSVGSVDAVETKDGDQLIVADSSNNRIMIWANPDESKGSDATLVLGQNNFSDCYPSDPDVTALRSIRGPNGVWSNGEKLVVSSEFNHRLLVWNTFPTASNQVSDFQLGQNSDSVSEVNNGYGGEANYKGMASPQGIGGNKHQMCVADTGNHRVLIWSQLPSSNVDLADIVIGQFDFSYSDSNIFANSRMLSWPTSCDISMEQLFIADSSNNRVLIFNALNKRPINN